MEKNKKEANKRKEEIMKRLKTKFIAFYIVGIVLMLLFWLYVSTFCAVYVNSQVFLILDTFIGFLLLNLYPLITNGFSGGCRNSALKDKEKKKESLYKTSQNLVIV